MKKLLYSAALTMGLLVAASAANACGSYTCCSYLQRSVGSAVSPATGFFGYGYYGDYGYYRDGYSERCYMVRSHHNRYGHWVRRHLVCYY